MGISLLAATTVLISNSLKKENTEVEEETEESDE